MLLWNVVAVAVAMRLLKICWDLANLKHQIYLYIFFSSNALHSECEWHAELTTMSRTNDGYILDFPISHGCYWMHFTQTVYKQLFRFQISFCGICFDSECTCLWVVKTDSCLLWSEASCLIHCLYCKRVAWYQTELSTRYCPDSKVWTQANSLVVMVFI